MVIVRLEATLPSSFSAVHSGRRAAALEIRIAALAVPNDMDNCRRRRARSFILSRRFFVRSRTHLPAMAESAAHHVFSVCFWQFPVECLGVRRAVHRIDSVCSHSLYLFRCRLSVLCPVCRARTGRFDVQAIRLEWEQKYGSLLLPHAHCFVCFALPFVRRPRIIFSRCSDGYLFDLIFGSHCTLYMFVYMFFNLASRSPSMHAHFVVVVIVPLTSVGIRSTLSND